MKTAKALASMYAEILRGVPKEESLYKDDPDFDFDWDTTSQQVEEIRQKYPDAQFDIPNEVPDVDDAPGEAKSEKVPAPGSSSGPAVENLKKKVNPA